MELGAEFTHGQGRALSGGFRQHVAQLGISRHQRSQGFHEQGLSLMGLGAVGDHRPSIASQPENDVKRHAPGQLV